MNYANSVKTVRSLLAKFGRSMTLVKDVIGTYDETTGKVTNTTTSVTDNGVLLPYSATFANGITSANNSLIQQGDAQVLINISVVPKPTDKLTVGSDTYTIINVKALEPSGLNTFYDMQVRK